MALDLFLLYATDEEAENNGTWFDIGGGTKLLIARAGNRKYGKMLTKLVEQNREVLDRGDDAAETKSDEIMVDVLASTILLGWESVTFKGEDFPYTPDNAKTLLKMRDFRRVVANKADDMDAYRAKVEIDLGNA